MAEEGVSLAGRSIDFLQLLGWKGMALMVILNGQSRSFEALQEDATLEQLVAELGLKADRVAIEHNGEIAPRLNWAQIGLREGDRLEVVHFVGGGV